MKIVGIENMTPHEISHELNRGAKFVRFRYTLSVFVLTVSDGTDVYFLRAGESRFAKALPFILFISGRLNSPLPRL